MTIASQNESTLDQTIGDATRGGTEETNEDRGKKIENRGKSPLGSIVDTPSSILSLMMSALKFGARIAA
jgi:hypothetical protein